MVKYFLITISICASIKLNAQDTLLTYHDMYWKKVSQKKAEYYRKTVENENETWNIQDFWLNNQIQMNGTFKSKRAKTKHGIFISYHQNGMKKSVGNFKDNEPIGAWSAWFESGQLRMQGKYNSNGERKGYWKRWYPNGKLNSEGSYLNGERDQEWKWYFDNSQLSAKETYNQGEPIQIQFWNDDGTPVEGDMVTELMPQFVGGVDSLMKYLRKNTRYPVFAQDQGISGTVRVNFLVAEDGSIENARITESDHSLLDQEALRVVKGMPKWIPGKEHNRPVRLSYTLPIHFQIRN